MTVTKTEKIEKKSYGDDIEVVDCDVVPKNGGTTATTEFRLKKKSDGSYVIYAESISNVPRKKHPYP